MGSQSVGLGGNLGSSEKHYARGICEMGDQNRPFFQARTAGRELLVLPTISSHNHLVQVGPMVLAEACRWPRSWPPLPSK